MSVQPLPIQTCGGEARVGIHGSEVCWGCSVAATDWVAVRLEYERLAAIPQESSARCQSSKNFGKRSGSGITLGHGCIHRVLPIDLARLRSRRKTPR